MRLRAIKQLLQDSAFRRLAVRENVKFGKNFHVGPGSIVWAPTELIIGKDVYIGKGVTLQVDGEIGDNVLIANGVGIVGRTDHDIHTVGVPVRSGRWVGDHPTTMSRAVTIGSDVWIGYGAIILSGVQIGDSSVVAAGSIVTRDIPPNSIVSGIPAEVQRERFNLVDFRRHWTLLREKGIRSLHH